MKISHTLIILILVLTACNRVTENTANKTGPYPGTEMPFNRNQWLTKDGQDYPFRDAMVKDVLYNDTIRSLNKAEILKLLGEPNRVEDGHLYYTVSQKRLGDWPLHTKTLVFKFSDDRTIEWIKIHK